MVCSLDISSKLLVFWFLLELPWAGGHHWWFADCSVAFDHSTGAYISLWSYPNKVRLLGVLRSLLLPSLHGSLEEGITTLHWWSLTEPPHSSPRMSLYILSILTITGVSKSLLEMDVSHYFPVACVCIINAVFIQCDLFPRSFQGVCACCDR